MGDVVSIKKGRREGTEEKPLSVGQQEPEGTAGSSPLSLRGHTEGLRDRAKGSRTLRAWARTGVRVRIKVRVRAGL